MSSQPSYYAVAFGRIVTAIAPDSISINARVVAVVDPNATEGAQSLVNQANCAHELLTALESALSFAHGNLQSGEEDRIIALAEAAIAKAKGKA